MHFEDERNVNTDGVSSDAPLLHWKTVPFQKAFEDATSSATKIPQGAFLRQGKFPVIDQGDGFIAGYSNDDLAVWRGDLPVIVFGDHTRAIKLIDFPFVLGADGCKVLLTAKEIRPRFAYYYLQSLGLEAAGYSRHFKFLKQATVRYPCRPEQERIEAQFEVVDRLRRTRRYAFELSDTLLQSVFLQMFGAPESNPRGWPKAAITEVCVKIIDYRGRTPEYSGGGIPHVTASCVKSNRINWKETRFVSNEVYEVYMTRGFPKQGDVLFTTEAPLGESAVVETDRKFSLAQRLLLLRPNKGKLNSHYLSRLVGHPAFFPVLREYSTGSTVKGIRSESFVAIPICIPPLSLQEQFANTVIRVERLRAQQRESLRQAEHLFQTLLHRAFATQN